MAKSCDRYARHVSIPEIGVEGQKKLEKAKVVIIGMGGLGSAAALYLASAGVGTVGVVDYDSVDFTNLQRQVLYTERDVGKKKVLAAKQRLAEINSDVKVIAHDTRVTAENASDILKNYDVVIDGTDNPQAKYAISDACVQLGKPDVSASVHRFEGQLSVFRKGSCYRCLFPRFPETETCTEAGVLGALAGVLGSMQAVEAVKLVAGAGKPLTGKLLVLDALDMEFRIMSLKKNRDCSVCNNYPSKDAALEIDAEELKTLLDGKRVALIDVREPNEYRICRIEGAKLIPVGKLQERMSELNKNSNVVLYCHHGSRSAKAAEMLRKEGFEARSLRGGIDEWARNIDRNMKRYQ